MHPTVVWMPCMQRALRGRDTFRMRLPFGESACVRHVSSLAACLSHLRPCMTHTHTHDTHTHGTLCADDDGCCWLSRHITPLSPHTLMMAGASTFTGGLSTLPSFSLPFSGETRYAWQVVDEDAIEELKEDAIDDRERDR